MWKKVVNGYLLVANSLEEIENWKEFAKNFPFVERVLRRMKIETIVLQTMQELHLGQQRALFIYSKDYSVNYQKSIILHDMHKEIEGKVSLSARRDFTLPTGIHFVDEDIFHIHIPDIIHASTEGYSDKEMEVINKLFKEIEGEVVGGYIYIQPTGQAIELVSNISKQIQNLHSEINKMMKLAITKEQDRIIEKHYIQRLKRKIEKLKEEKRRVKEECNKKALEGLIREAEEFAHLGSVELVLRPIEKIKYDGYSLERDEIYPLLLIKLKHPIIPQYLKLGDSIVEIPVAEARRYKITGVGFSIRSKTFPVAYGNNPHIRKKGIWADLCLGSSEETASIKDLDTVLNKLKVINIDSVFWGKDELKDLFMRLKAGGGEGEVWIAD